MPVNLSLLELLRITGGRPLDEPPLSGERELRFNGVEFDSRQIKGGELFVALPGEKTRGEVFVAEAFRRGAALAIAADAACLTDNRQADRVVIVDDALRAFWRLASWWRLELKTPLAAVTGSVGKTTVKEMCAALLQRQGKGIFSLKSHNNHTGVPYTLCRLSAEHAWGLIEIGMNHAGEIRELTQITRPDAAAITGVEAAHLESLGSLEAIAGAKLEIINGLKNNGPLIINGDNQVLCRALAELKLEGRYPIKYFGSNPGFAACVRGVEMHGLDGISFELLLEGQSLPVRMPLLGRQNALNAACAALVARTLRPALTAREIKAGLEGFTAPLMRLALKQLRSGKKIIDDSYNANPASMRAMLDVASSLKKDYPRLGLILGDMLELGRFAGEYHRQLGAQAALLKPAFVVAVGEFAGLILDAVGRSGIKAFQAESPEDAAKIARAEDFDILLIKASRLVGLDRTVKVLEG